MTFLPCLIDFLLNVLGCHSTYWGQDIYTKLLANIKLIKTVWLYNITFTEYIYFETTISTLPQAFGPDITLCG